MISRKNIYSLYSLIGWGCNSHNADQNGQNRAPGKRGALEFAHQLSQDFEPPKSKWEGYMKSALKQWEPAPVVGKNKGMPGEMGKVRIHNLTKFFPSFFKMENSLFQKGLILMMIFSFFRLCKFPKIVKMRKKKNLKSINSTYWHLK